MKRIIPLSLALLVLAVPFVFSGGEAEEKAKDWTKEKVTLKIEASGWILQKFPVEASGKKFMADHPNVNVEVSAQTSLEAYMLNWSAGDVNVDLCFGGATTQMAMFAFKDLLVPWNDFYTGEFSRDKFLTHSVELPKRGNDYYALPFMVEGMSLEANRDMMIAAGLGSGKTAAKPKSLEELYQFSKKLTKGTGEVKDVYGFSWNFTNFGDQQLFFGVNCLDGKAYNADHSPNLEAPEIVDIFSFIKRVTNDGYGSKGTITNTNAGREGLMAGTVAIICEAASRAIEAKPKIGDAAILLPFPGEEKNGSFIYAHNTYIPRGTKVKDVAWAFMREQGLSEEFSKFGAERYGKLPSMYRNYEGLSADFSEIQQWLANPKTVGDHPWVDGAKLNLLIFELEQSLVTSAITPEQAAKQLRERASKLNLTVVK
jgi:ABC-type glycerol-3-phosphate transport system substrate-binding protein